ncbi:hypothetical protein [Aneurinibacillus terranovensis]|uniref:hypothetical protein n=1 Tax=Aneurinibacillus terranovensis TaxID=278991 RepID=UPI000485E3C1|nr:hypothetical protein [Aneurinibacillus terranovensis]
MKGLFLIIFSVMVGSVGQVLLKVGMNKIGSTSLNVLPSKLITIFTNPMIVLGFICFISSSLLWMVVISGNQLSSAYPMVSLGYIFVFIMSIFLFNETVTVPKSIGLMVIVLGVFLMNKG